MGAAVPAREADLKKRARADLKRNKREEHSEAAREHNLQLRGLRSETRSVAFSSESFSLSTERNLSLLDWFCPSKLHSSNTSQ